MKRFNRRVFMRSTGVIAASWALQSKGIAWAEGAPFATTTAGKVSGAFADGVNVFKGIPYGGDTAETRFKAPVPPTPWSDVKECTHFAAMAPQLVGARAMTRAAHGEGGQSEDCLHLNVWTAGLRDHRKRPVLVYFHGGAYNNGSVNNDLYDGTRLVHRGDVVVVTVNHRLNAFGYLYLGDLAAEYAESGNAGQLDLILALKWVRENIAEFGGDPSRVLIFGQSGGGAKCAALMATPAAHGLFHRVMTMSGQQIKGASIEIASGRARTVLEKMGVTPGKNLAAQLNALTMEQIQEGAAAVSGDWLPVVDHVTLARNPFDPDAPALSETVPMILGNVHDETSVAGSATATWETAVEALKSAISQYLGPYTAEEVVAKYREIYPGYTPDQVVTAAATAFRAWPGQRWEAERRASNPRSQPHTWVYQMNFTGANGKAMHTIDIPFVFDNIAMAEAQVGSTPEQLAAANALAATMSEMLITYGRTGNPNFAGLPHWPAYDLKNRSTMMWERTPRIENDPRGAERVFADKAHYHQAGTPLP
ncbi:MAG: carboxylesterase family protein [Terracidiphilus sp.]|jgi:para-nitrobenzyl esterase